MFVWTVLVRAGTVAAVSLAGWGLAAGLLAATAGCQAPPRHWVEPLTGMEFRLLPAGSFVMGSPFGETGREEQEAPHPVRISRPFYMGRHEVTQGQWQRVMGDNPSRFRDCGADCPVESVDWHAVQAFVERLNRITAGRFRLPTEAEWEYACRAGTTTAFATGESLTTSQANFDDEDAGAPAGEGPGRPGRSPVAVGSYPANRWGLFDLHGNVWEWTADDHCPYPSAAVTDPHGECATELKVIRGGSWHYGADSARCALRYTHRPRDRGFSLGFRLARSVE